MYNITEINKQHRVADKSARLFYFHLSPQNRTEIISLTSVTLTHYATNRKVAGSIPDGVIAVFHRRNPSSRTVVLGSTRPVTDMSTRKISWGVKAAGT